jgi:hypothetical protein
MMTSFWQDRQGRQGYPLASRLSLEYTSSVHQETQ